MAVRPRLPSGPAWAAWGLLLALWPAPAPAATPPAPAADPGAARLARLVAAYEGVRTVTASFTQQTRFAGFPRPRTYMGRVELERPDHMRWDYNAGSAQQVYVNGRTVTVYVPEASQAVESRLTPASDRQVPLQLLADVTRIDRTYDVAAGADPDELVLTPRDPGEGAPESVHLWLDPQGLIGRVRLLLPGGSQSDLTFTGVRTNVPIPPGRFDFTAPEGTHRIRADSLLPAPGAARGTGGGNSE